MYNNGSYINVLCNNDDYVESSLLMAGCDIPGPLYGITVSVFDTFDEESNVIYDLKTLGFETPDVNGFGLEMSASNPNVVSQWDRHKIVLLFEFLLNECNGSGFDVPDTMIGMEIWKYNLFTLEFDICDIIYDKLVFIIYGKDNNNCDNCDGLNRNKNMKYGLTMTGCDIVIYPNIVSDASVSLELYNISNFIYNSDNNNNNDNMSLCKIFYDYNKINFVFYYYVKIYFEYHILPIWRWIEVNVFIFMFGILDCVLVDYLGKIKLCSIVMSVSYLY